MATAVLEDPTGYGRVVRAPDGTVERVVETKAPGDATELELHIREVNTGIFAFDGAALLDALEQVRGDNAQGELYLPDVLPILRAHERTVVAHELRGPDARRSGSTTASRSRASRAIAQRRIHERHMLAGVTIVDPDATVIDADVEIGQDTVIAPFTSLHGDTRIGAGCTVGPHTTVIDTTHRRRRTVLHSYLKEADVGDRVSVGPFAYLRPGAILREGSKVGHVRRDQELRHRRRLEGAAPVLHRRRRHRRGARTSARHDHRQLRRLAQAPHDDRLAA